MTENSDLLPCPFCGGEAAPLDENDHTSCTNIACGSTAYMHVWAWNERPCWRDMGTAPNDARILAVVDGEVRTVRYGKTSHVPIYGFCLVDQGSEDADICSPTAWMPFPSPPAILKAKQMGVGE